MSVKALIALGIGYTVGTLLALGLSQPEPQPVPKEVDMLVLTRKRDEKVMIGDNIVVTVVDIRGDKVRLGVEAPSDVPVHRQEVYDAIKRDQRRQTQLSQEQPATNPAPAP